jgi:hypothetical protein
MGYVAAYELDISALVRGDAFVNVGYVRGDPLFGVPERPLPRCCSAARTSDHAFNPGDLHVRQSGLLQLRYKLQPGEGLTNELITSAMEAARMAEPYPEFLAACSHLLAVGRAPLT